MKNVKKKSVKKSVVGPGGLVLCYDAEQVYPDDPGLGTPLLVSMPFSNKTGTYWSAMETGHLDGDIALTPKQNEWLRRMEGDVSDWLERVTRHIQSEGREAYLEKLRKGVAGASDGFSAIPV